MKTKNKSIAIFFSILFSITFASALPEIWTTDIDGNPTEDFSPEEIVYVHGSEFLVNAFVAVEITRPDFVIETGNTLTDGVGGFIFEYDLNGIVGNYYIYATDGTNSAQVIFTDAAIWTTKSDCGTSGQDENHYVIGEDVYINGDGFNPANYSWEIKGKPGGASCDPNIIVVNGTKEVNSSGEFCFNAYTVAGDDCGEYQVKFGVKGDNYRVQGVECGDGNVDDGEECDDGNNDDEDGCSSFCEIEECGDGIFQQGLGEGCDDGNNDDGDGCSSQCVVEFCGDDIIQEGLGEQCEPPNTDTCDDECQEINEDFFCGNGIMEGNEECDDGNNDDGDGCDNNCDLEFTCNNADLVVPVELEVVGHGCHPNPSIDTEIISMSLTGSTPFQVVVEVHRSGAGQPQPKEEFTLEVNGLVGPNVQDFPPNVEVQEQFAGTFNFTDGNNTIIMNSTAQCPPDTTPNSVEIVNLCLRNPDPYCGNGFKELGEECDDGNDNNDDECRNDCSSPKCQECDTVPIFECEYAETLTDFALNNLGFDNIVRLGNGENFVGGDGTRDIVFTSGGNNVISTGNMADFICSGNGADTINSGVGDDVIFAGTGNDIIDAGSGHDFIDAGSGHDNVTGGIGNDCINLGIGNDYAEGGSGNDNIDGGSGMDEIHGGQANDLIFGGIAGDTIFGDGGSDRIGGGNGDDIINGGNSGDTIDGGIGKDNINGGGGNDIIQGAFGVDVLDGAGGNNDKSDDDPADSSVINIEDVGGAPFLDITLDLSICSDPIRVCGDGIVQTPNTDGQNEECDDGNDDNSDGCRNNCTLCEDADNDGACDSDDQCPGTPEQTEVDDLGCSHIQFCNRETYCGAQCKFADWKYDEQDVENPHDCILAIKFANGKETLGCSAIEVQCDL